MFKKWKYRILGIETVLDGVITVLRDKDILTREEIQAAITRFSYEDMDGIHINRGPGFTHHPNDDCDPRNYEE